LKYEKCCSQLSTYFKKHMAFRKADESLACSTKLDSLIKPALFHSKISTTSETSINE
jgi:hypothetical protein